MKSNNFAAIILAAGKGTRMKSSVSKVLHSVGNRSMLMHNIDLCISLGVKNITVVVGSDSKDVEEEIPKNLPGIKIVKQKKQNGTADALISAKKIYEKFKGTIFVLYADVPLVRNKTLKKLMNSSTKKLSLIGFYPKKNKGYGRVVLEKNTISEIVEEKVATAEQKKITLCNSGIIGGPSILIFDLLNKIKKNDKVNEFLLTDIFNLNFTMNKKTEVIIALEKEMLGVNDRKSLSLAEKYFQERKRSEVMLKGVTLVSSDTVYFSFDTVIEKDVTIEPNVIFGTNVYVGSFTKIFSNTYLQGVKINKNCNIGPYARIRGKTNISSNVKIGNFVEIKNSNIGLGSKVNHLSYIGDTTIGSSSNIGAGTITCNYNGVKKNRTFIGNNVFIGSNSSLVAPIKIEDDTLIAAGSIVTKSIRQGNLAISRSKQINIPNGREKIFNKLKRNN